MTKRAKSRRRAVTLADVAKEIRRLRREVKALRGELVGQLADGLREIAAIGWQLMGRRTEETEGEVVEGAFGRHSRR